MVLPGESSDGVRLSHMSMRDAIQAGRADILDGLLNADSAPETRDYNWLAARAVDHQSLDSLEVLLQHGWNINTPENYFRPPLLGKLVQDGCKRGDLNMTLIEWFLDHGASPNAYAGQHKTTPLSDAVRYGNFGLVKLFFDYGGSAAEGDLVYHLYTYEALQNHSDFLRKWDFLVQRKAPVDEALFERFLDLVDVTMFTYTPRINACVSGNSELVKLLLAAGADPRKPTSLGYTPLRAAEDKGNEDVRQLLLRALATSY